MKLARRTCVRFPGPFFRKIPDISENWSGLHLEDVTASYFLRTACPNLHICGKHNGFIFCRDQFPEISGIFRESGPGIAAIHHFLRNIPNISGKYFGDYFPEIFQIFREMLSSKYPEYFGKIVWSTTIEISGRFRKNGAGFERSRCDFQIKSRGIYVPVRSNFG